MSSTDHGGGKRRAGMAGFRLVKVLSGRRETHSGYFWNTQRERRAGSECAVVSADFDFGRLPKLHLRHV
jgi:hypothetical protein